MRTPPHQKNTFLIVLIAVSALVAFLLFLDAFVPVIPDGKERPDRGEEYVEETKKNWLKEFFDRKEPGDPDAPEGVETRPALGNGDPIPRPIPSVQLYYTEEEMLEHYYDILSKSLTELERMESRGEILPISQVGLFNVDMYGTPEIILQYETGGGQMGYAAYELLSLEQLVFWSSEGQGDELTVWEENGSDYATLFTHYGDGDDRYVCELESTDRIRYMELAAEIWDGDVVTYRYQGKKTNQNAYRIAISGIDSAYRALLTTALRLTTWHSDADKAQLAKIILSSGQEFLRTDRTEP